MEDFEGLKAQKAVEKMADEDGPQPSREIVEKAIQEQQHINPRFPAEDFRRVINGIIDQYLAQDDEALVLRDELNTNPRSLERRLYLVLQEMFSFSEQEAWDFIKVIIDYIQTLYSEDLPN